MQLDTECKFTYLPRGAQGNRAFGCETDKKDAANETTNFICCDSALRFPGAQLCTERAEQPEGDADFLDADSAQLAGLQR
jgi:hypothetical protein